MIGKPTHSRLVPSNFNSGLSFSFLQHGEVKPATLGVVMDSFIMDRITRSTRSITLR